MFLSESEITRFFVKSSTLILLSIIFPSSSIFIKSLTVGRKEYLFSKGVETKTIQYVDCQNIFKSKTNIKNLKRYENQVLCLPNHRFISKKYIEYIVNLLNEFYKKND